MHKNPEENTAVPPKIHLVGQSLGGFFAPRALAFDERVTKCVSIAQFGTLKMNFSDNPVANGIITDLLNIVLYGFGWLINIVISGSKDAMACRAGLGRHLLVLRNAWSVSSREITTYAEQCRK